MVDKSVARIEVLDPEMERLVDPKARFDAIASERKFTEGPVWMPRENQLVFSDIPASALYAWSEASGLREFRIPSNNANGNALDREGRLITCEHSSRRVTRTESNGEIVVIAERYQGRRLNSPNDVVVKRDGSIWFTDPPYGIKREQKELDGNYVFRLDSGALEPVIVASDLQMPNGLCFSPDEETLYISDSSKERHHIKRYRVSRDNTLQGDGVFVAIEPHVPDGIRMDSEGRLFSTAGDGVQVFACDGRLIGKFLTPQVAANCCFGGPQGRDLFITATTSVWRVRLRG